MRRRAWRRDLGPACPQNVLDAARLLHLKRQRINEHPLHSPHNRSRRPGCNTPSQRPCTARKAAFSRGSVPLFYPAGAGADRRSGNCGQPSICDGQASRNRPSKRQVPMPPRIYRFPSTAPFQPPPASADVRMSPRRPSRAVSIRSFKDAGRIASSSSNRKPRNRRR